MKKLITKSQRLYPQWFYLLYKEVVVLQWKSPQVEGFSTVYCEIFPFIQILILGTVISGIISFMWFHYFFIQVSAIVIKLTFANGCNQVFETEKSSSILSERKIRVAQITLHHKDRKKILTIMAALILTESDISCVWILFQCYNCIRVSSTVC